MTCTVLETKGKTVTTWILQKNEKDKFKEYVLFIFEKIGNT